MDVEVPRKLGGIKPRVASAAAVAGWLVGGFALWLGLGWGIDCYVASTAEGRFNTAMRTGDRASACTNAEIAAEAYGVAQYATANQQWLVRASNVCGR